MKEYRELTNAEKNQFVRDMCRITGCAPLKGKTQASKTLPIRSFVESPRTSPRWSR